MARLAGKVAVITGAASGMGEATARLFAQEGASVLIADLQDEKGAAVVREIEATGGKAAYAHADVSSGEDVQAVFRRAAELWGGIDIVYNNAGVGYNEGRIGDAAEEDFDRIIAIDLKGVWLGMKHSLPYLIARGGGSIISTASIAGLLGFATLGSYSAAKGGVIQLTKVLAVEYARENIRANCICPGGIATPLVLENPRFLTTVPREVQLENMAQIQPIRRAGQPLDIAQAALWLASDESSFVTGQALVVDGGYVVDAARGGRQRRG
ncbi:MAG TPA: glucose 1-dehydrogenase [Dehalococcoidia bacterium]|nr:glucose 1-dehydrogenase [Dehalococcoidia bacterium]